MAGSTPTAKTQDEKIASLRKIINDASAAFLVTRRGTTGTLHGRPMATAAVEDGIAAIWFATGRDSGKVEEIDADPRVYLGFTNGSGSEWASVNGHARIVDDRAKVRELWTPLWKNWFDGPDDPQIVLIEVTPDDAEYWDSGSRLVMWAKMAQSAVTGQKLPDGEHETVKIGSSHAR